MNISVCAFDAYGTLFDVASAARAAAGEPGREAFAAKWQAVSELWRFKQLQYSWLRAAAGIHTDFWSLTTDALDYALEAEGLADAELRARLLALYRELSAFPEVPAMLDALRAAGAKCTILSNASPAMLASAIESAGLASRLDAVLTAESTGVFKPDFRVYDLVGQAFGVARREVLFVSSNGWDAWAGSAYGFRTVWANRKGEPVDRLSAVPEFVVPDLSGVPEIAARL